MAKETTETTAQKIARLKQEVELLEKQDQEEKNAKIKALPESLGYGAGTDGFVALVTALLPYTEGKMKIGKSTKAAPKASGGGKRGTVTPEIREAIVADLKGEVMTTAEIAAKYTLSTATISTIKRAAGLTKPKAA